MPKMKTNSAASKRAKITGTGKVKHVGSAMRHNLRAQVRSAKRTVRRRQLRGGCAKQAAPASAEVSIGLTRK